MFNYREIKENIATLVQRSGDTSFITDIGVWVNISLLTLYNAYDYWLELKGTHNFTTVDGTALYYMPSDFNKPMRFYDITHDKKITIDSEESYFDANIANIADSNESDADTAYFKEVVGVKVQVATTGDTVQIKSSSASDADDTVTVEGYLDSDLTIIGYETVTLTGTAYAAGSTTFYKILGFSKNTDSTGYFTLADSSDVVLATLGQNERVARYKAFRLGQIPDDSTTSMRVLYKRTLRKMVNDNDYPFVECSDYLIYNSVSLALQHDKETLDRAVLMKKNADIAFGAILNNQNSILGPDYQHKYVPAIGQAHRV